MKPVIAVICYTDINRYGNMSHVAPLAYTTAIETAGGLAYIVPYTDRFELLPEILHLARGILFTGGMDVDPTLYYESKNPCCGATDNKLDAYQLAAFHIACDRKMPVLAICRGAQLINVALGGTLYQDIFTDLSGPLHQHIGDNLETGDEHIVTIEPDTELYRLFGASVLTNSRHHQAIKTPAKNLKITARSSDGIIEGMEHCDLPITLVQWHPEMMVSTQKPTMLPLFQAFVKQCSKMREESHQLNS